MNNLFTTDFIKNAPISVAILDKNLCFTSYSKIWLKEFNIKEKKIVGKYYYDVIPNTPERLRRVHQRALQGKSSNIPGQRFIDLDGNIQWLKWKVDPWNDYEGNNAGIIIFAEDITATTRKKELLKKVENVSKIGGWELDLATNQLHWTAVTKKIHEVANDYIPKIEEGINFYKEGEQREKITILINKCIKEGESYDEELHIVTAKGNELWVRAKGEAEFHKGKCVRLVGTFQDINSEKKIELKYKETAERLKVATSAANIGIWEFDVVNDELAWNNQMFELYGIKREDFEGVYEAWKCSVHEDDQEYSQKEVEMALKGEKEFNTEFRVVWPNGTVRYIQATAVIHRDKKGIPLKMIGTNWDITQTKEAQLKYKEVADRLNLATNAAQIGIWEYDIANDNSVWDDNVYKLYGIDKEGFDGSDAAWRSMIHPEDREKTKIEEEMALNGEKDLNQSYRVVWPNGSIRHIQSAAILLKDEKGNPHKMIGTNWDITPIKEAQLKYKEVADRLNIATTAAKIGIWEYQFADDSFTCNDQQYELYGIKKEDFDGDYAAWRSLIHPEDLGKTRIEEDMVLKGEKDYNISFRVVWPNGNIRHIQSAAVLLKDKEGNPLKMIGTNWDITPIIEANSRYAEVSERLKIAANAAQIGIWEYDFNNDSHVWNDQVYELHGVKKEDFAGGYEAWRSLIHPEDQEKTKIEEEMVLKGEKDLNHNYRVVWPNSNIRHIQATAVLLKDEKGNPLKMIGTNWDITPIKQAQLQYKEVADRLNLATNAAQIGIWEYDIANDRSIWDDQVYKLYGVNKEDFDGSDAAWRAMIHPEDQEKVRIEEEKVLKGEKELNHNFRVVWLNGNIRYLRSAAVLIKDEKGRPLKMIGTNWDITSVKEAEEELRKLLEVTNEQNNNLLNFAHIVSHNLRSHSSNLSMLSSFLVNEENEEERKKLITMVDEATNGLNETVQHLNEVVQVKTNVNGNMAPINLYTAVKSVEKNIRTLFKEKEVICTIDVPKSHNLQAVPAYLDSILLNLFTNSIKYSAPNRQPQILVSSKKEGNKVVVAFSDNGQGIDLDRHGRKIFGMYKTFHGNEDAKGIGLFITKNQIEAMNGKIEVESTVDVGTTFNLYFDAN